MRSFTGIISKILAPIVAVPLASCTSMPGAATNAITAGSGAFVGHELSGGEPEGALLGAAAGVVTGELLNHSREQGKRDAYSRGYDKGRSDEVKRLYWVQKGLHQGDEFAVAERAQNSRLPSTRSPCPSTSLQTARSSSRTRKSSKSLSHEIPIQPRWIARSSRGQRARVVPAGGRGSRAPEAARACRKDRRAVGAERERAVSPEERHFSSARSPGKCWKDDATDATRGTCRTVRLEADNSDDSRDCAGMANPNDCTCECRCRLAIHRQASLAESTIRRTNS